MSLAIGPYGTDMACRAVLVRQLAWFDDQCQVFSVWMRQSCSSGVLRWGRPA
jgi:hypothetical protein